jgi:hypothetical protein
VDETKPSIVDVPVTLEETASKDGTEEANRLLAMAMFDLERLKKSRDAICSEKINSQRIITQKN